MSSAQEHCTHLTATCRFFEFQQSGRIPPWSRAAYVRGGWRLNSHMQDGFGIDGIGQDLTGGYYDAGGAGRGNACSAGSAGPEQASTCASHVASCMRTHSADHLKLVLPLGFAISQMSLAAIVFQ